MFRRLRTRWRSEAWPTGMRLPSASGASGLENSIGTQDGQAPQRVRLALLLRARPGPFRHARRVRNRRLRWRSIHVCGSRPSTERQRFPCHEESRRPHYRASARESVDHREADWRRADARVGARPASRLPPPCEATSWAHASGAPRLENQSLAKTTQGVLDSHRSARHPNNRTRSIDQVPVELSRQSRSEFVDIAELLGVTHQRASKIAGEPRFPAPVGREGQSRFWDRREVQA